MSDTLTRAEIDRARTRATDTRGCSACGSPVAEAFDCAEDVVRLLDEREVWLSILHRVRDSLAHGLSALGHNQLIGLLRAAGEEDAL